MRAFVISTLVFATIQSQAAPLPQQQISNAVATFTTSNMVKPAHVKRIDDGEKILAGTLGTAGGLLVLTGGAVAYNHYTTNQELAPIEAQNRQLEMEMVERMRSRTRRPGRIADNSVNFHSGTIVVSDRPDFMTPSTQYRPITCLPGSSNPECSDIKEEDDGHNNGAVEIEQKEDHADLPDGPINNEPAYQPAPVNDEDNTSMADLLDEASEHSVPEPTTIINTDRTASIDSASIDRQISALSQTDVAPAISEMDAEANDMVKKMSDSLPGMVDDTAVVLANGAKSLLG